MKDLAPFEIPLDGVRLIEANAGTGKTFTITTLYLRLLLESALEVGRILVVTYTNAATAELRHKIRQRIADLLRALRGVGEPADATLAKLAARRRSAGAVAADCQRLEAALYGFDEAAIFTIHGFCQRILQEHAFESGVTFDAELIGDERLLIDEVVQDFWSRELYAAPLGLIESLPPAITPGTLSQLAAIMAAHPDIRVVPDRPAGELDALIASGSAPADALARRQLQFQMDLIAYAAGERRRRKEAANTQSFDDLLQRLAAALECGGLPPLWGGWEVGPLAAKIRQRFPVALIDEFQDTDPVQARIFEGVYRAPGAALFLIGDPKQAIYAFRGADVFTYVGARQRAADELYALTVNRRSSPGLLRAVNALFGRARLPFLLDDIPYFASTAADDQADVLDGAAAGRPPLRVLFAARPDGKPFNKSRVEWLHRAVAGEITRSLNEETLIGDHRLVPGDIAVLSRTNSQSAAMQAVLTELGVPTVLYGDTSVFDTREAVAVERVMRAMADPGDSSAVAAALLTPLLGVTGDALAALRADEREWERWVERFQRWREAWQSHGFTVGFRRLLDEREVAGRVLAQVGGERCLTNVLHLVELLQAAAVDARRGPLALIEWLQRMRSDEDARFGEAAESAQIRLESDTQALKLLTIHKSKGLQFPVVICPFVWEDANLRPADRRHVRFHDAAAGDRLTLDLGSPRRAAHLEQSAREALAEQTRLLYVALTRAQHYCVIAWGRFNLSDNSALGYLLHQPRDTPLDGLASATAARIKTITDAEMLADLRDLAAASKQAIEVVPLVRESPRPYRAPDAAGSALELRTMSRTVRQPWRLASFSALAASERPVSEPAEEGVDRDELADEALDASALAATAVRGFPRGRRLGTLVHKLFETVDFTAVEPAALRAEATRLMPSHGVDPQYADTICAAIGDVLDTPLDDRTPALTLRQIPPRRRLNELEFVFPVGLTERGDHPGLVAEHVASVLAAHGAPWMADYAARVRQLTFADLAGYLKGFIDLVFAHDERWFVVDYKTNDLGPSSTDYRATRLLPEMQRHHYVLQYHLYTVAVHRYLRRRLPGYDYERHFGGVLYLFVRGMAPAHERGCGVFFERPPARLIDALSEALAQPPGRAGAVQGER